MTHRYLIASLLLACGVMHGQTSTASLQGSLRDATGAVLPGASVRATNLATGTANDAVANSAGSYYIPYLQPGNYSVTATHTGFQRFHQTGIKLDVQQVLTFDITLAVGDVTSTVEVVGTPPALATAVSVVGTTTENRQINDLPLNGRVGLELALLSPGVIPAEGNAGSSVGIVDGSAYPHSFTPWIAGSRNATSEVLMDGVPLGLPNTNSGTMTMGISGPTVDAVQEFTIFTSALPAEYGRTGGGVVNTASKQGTNQLRGTLHEFLRNDKLDANYFFSNRAGIPRRTFQRNHYGGTTGGPVYLPSLYNGRNRTFFHFDLERSQARVPNLLTTTVPLPEWTRGDFSGLRTSSGAAEVIYDPVTAAPDAGGTWLRSPFAGNIIPVSRMDPVGRKLAQYYPVPNTSPTNRYTQANNWTRLGKDRADAVDYGIRIDHVISDRWRTFGRLTRGHNNTTPQNFFDNEATPLGRGFQTFRRNAFVWDNTVMLNPSTVLNLRYGMARMNLDIDVLSAGFRPSSIGFPAYMDTEASKNALRFPRIDVTGLSSLGQMNNGGLTFVPTTHNGLGSVTRMMNRHVIKAGAEYRQMFLNFWQEAQPAGAFTFNTLWTQRGPATAQGGNALASLLVGLPGAGNQANTIVAATASRYYAGFVQDDFRVSSRLTLNIGLRYDVDIPRTERFNQLSRFNAVAPSPLASKVPGYPDLRGAMEFTKSGDRRQSPTDWTNVAPRVGFAYRASNRTAFRAAYAILYAPSLLQAGYQGTEGFSSRTNMTVSTDSNRTPLNYLSNPFPYGFNAVLGATEGPDSGSLTNIGLAVGDSWFPSNTSPIVQQWNSTLQREMPGGFLVELGYLGNKGNHLCDGETLTYNQIPASYLSLREKLNNQVPNPFYGVITNPNSTLSRTTVTYRQTLSPFPQYVTVNPSRPPFGNSLYHSFTARVERRFSKGLGLRLAYTGGKLIDDSGYASTLNAGGATTRQDVYNRALDRAVSSQDVSSRLVISGNAQLPFGKKRMLLNSLPPALNTIVGGWQVNGIVSLQRGLPIVMTQTLNQTALGNAAQRPDNNGQSAQLPARSKSEELAKWFDTSAFSMAQAFTFGTVGRTLPDVRHPGRRNVDLSLFKEFRYRERFQATFRAEAFNILNTAQFGRANSQVGNTEIGTINSTAVAPRQVQLALKLRF